MKNLVSSINNKTVSISVVGLGYVGMPIAVEFSKHVNVIGFDISEEKIELYKSGVDPTNEVGDLKIRESNVKFTNDPSSLLESKFHIVAVPTPINQDKTPNLEPVIGASKIIGENLSKGSIVVYESTVYPGVTEDICIPILEQNSGLKCGVDFKVGYSPERINPGDKIHTLENIVKIVSGMDEESLNIIEEVYKIVIKAGVHRASSIKVAEAAKVVENSQRDINIAFMNELAMVFNKMGINTNDVIQAMNTKWNALGFYPGLVGGHCIGVDPYYFVYEAEKLGYHSQIILSGRKINDTMGKFVAENAIKNLILADKNIKKSKIGIFGLTFKEDCPDIRNSKVIDIIDTLNEYGVEPILVDYNVNNREFINEYKKEISSIEDVRDLDCIILAVGHEKYKSMLASDWKKISSSKGGNVFIDVKSILNENEIINNGFIYWNL
ncbi:nucleotide sugar dehydrogenase [Exiguobacterium sp. RIT341]|uniref:nucleotide sugar dehydrogenase n=1 Tax=Exiguobacterium sp. RIT341 TaxID=1470592 RepID=UPI00044C59D9|nr:nucleotide sugar dehydrogenase [Exiguobacterium sp. RIT341]EZP59695.1 UDP-N-acetyl-D-galactosamine dehydrogenase [Exiguobacterium sp. RIT341]